MTASDSKEPRSPDFAPVRMDEIELSAPLPRLNPGRSESGLPYGSSMSVVRLHGTPLGLVDIRLPTEGLEPDALAALLQRELGEELARHLREDGLPLEAVKPDGIASVAAPPCLAARERSLETPPTISVVI
ncbi:MAG: hypothetical protein WBM00_09935, partial [Solirubrobacterales bacterium]